MDHPIVYPPPTAEHSSAPSLGKDHALVLHQFLGGVQVFGGITLVAAYSLGATALEWSAASGLLVLLGLLQITLGVRWLVGAKQLRRGLLRHPGAYVAGTLAAAVAVAALGGSGVERVYITSAQCWLIAAGWSLQGWRVASGTAVCVVIVGPIWILVDGSGGGYGLDGVYFTAILGWAASVLAGLWLGRTTGNAAATLNRWFVVEQQELGVVQRLRGRIADVDRHATALAESLPPNSEIGELSALRERLALGVGASEATEPVRLSTVLAELSDGTDRTDGVPRLSIVAADAGSVVVAPVVADALLAVLRRQLDNVTRHAPSATIVTLTAELSAGSVRVQLEDDGEGALPFRAGAGTDWSTRQLARVGGSARYYRGEGGVGFAVHVPVDQRSELPAVEGLSVRREMDRFGGGMLAALRWAGYIGDSIGAHALADDIGLRWVLMPLGAIVIELLLWRGTSLLKTREAATLAAAFVAVALAAVFSIPADSPSGLVPATTSVVIVAHLIYLGQLRLWALAEVLRLAAVAALWQRYGAATAGLLLIYPVGIYVIVLLITRFKRRAQGLEQRAADAMGRAALAAATVRGLALRHDALDVIERTSPAGAAIAQPFAELDRALRRLASATAGALAPFSVMVTGLEAALDRPVVLESDRVQRGEAADTPLLAGAVDRITLVELAALAADERASCAPPGIFGRRRLDALAVEWSPDDGRGGLMTLVARPTLGPPSAESHARLVAVAEAVGVEVGSTPAELTLRYARVEPAVLGVEA